MNQNNSSSKPLSKNMRIPNTQKDSPFSSSGNQVDNKTICLTDRNDYTYSQSEMENSFEENESPRTLNLNTIDSIENNSPSLSNNSFNLNEFNRNVIRFQQGMVNNPDKKMKVFKLDLININPVIAKAEINLNSVSQRKSPTNAKLESIKNYEKSQADIFSKIANNYKSKNQTVFRNPPAVSYRILPEKNVKELQVKTKINPQITSSNAKKAYASNPLGKNEKKNKQSKEKLKITNDKTASSYSNSNKKNINLVTEFDKNKQAELLQNNGTFNKQINKEKDLIYKKINKNKNNYKINENENSLQNMQNQLFSLSPIKSHRKNTLKNNHSKNAISNLSNSYLNTIGVIDCYPECKTDRSNTSISKIKQNIHSNRSFVNNFPKTEESEVETNKLRDSSMTSFDNTPKNNKCNQSDSVTYETSGKISKNANSETNPNSNYMNSPGDLSTNYNSIINNSRNFNISLIHGAKLSTSLIKKSIFHKQNVSDLRRNNNLETEVQGGDLIEMKQQTNEMNDQASFFNFLLNCSKEKILTKENDQSFTSESDNNMKDILSNSIPSQSFMRENINLDSSNNEYEFNFSNINKNKIFTKLKSNYLEVKNEDKLGKNFNSDNFNFNNNNKLNNNSMNDRKSLLNSKDVNETFIKKYENTKSAKDIKVYPTDFMYGLLSAHVAVETGHIGGKCHLLENSKVMFKDDKLFYESLLAKKNIHINSLVNDWFIEKIIDNEETGYCGIIYKNILTQNIVLAHRSTNFKLSLGSNLFKQSGAQVDCQTITLGVLVPHMALGHQATKIAVDIARKLNYTLSITGHSLGSFLAQMSMYYCHCELNYKYVKAVVFDGPGCWNMLNLLNTNVIKNQVNIIRLEDLDIVSYITAPNYVNCLNTHIGKVFTIFPNIETDLGIYSTILKKLGKNYEQGICTTAIGHDIINILPYFDVDTGRPIECHLVVRWPKILHQDFGLKKKSSSVASTILIGSLLPSSCSDFILDFFNNYLKEENVLSTFESLILFSKDFITGKNNNEEFWNVHKFLNKENNFKKPKDLDTKQEYNLTYSQNYLTRPYNLFELTLNDKNDDIDRFLHLIKQKGELLDGFVNSIEMLVPIWNYYKYYQGLNQIIINEEFRSEITVQDLRDYVRFLLIKRPDLLNRLTSSRRKSFLASKPDNKNKLNSLKESYKILNELIHKEKSRYPEENDYIASLDNELEKIEQFLSKSFNELFYKYQIILFGRTNAGKSTLGSKLLLDEENLKIFPTSAIAETFIPCKISISEEIEKASIQINYKSQSSKTFEADTLESLVKILNNSISKKSISFDDEIIEDTVIITPRNFFPKFQSGTTIIDTPGFSENEQMKNFNLSQLAKEKNRSVIIFLIPLEVGGSLMQENLDILSAYNSEEKDLSSNIIFVLTKLKNFKNSCEAENNYISDEGLLNYMNGKIQEGFVLPLKNKYPSARIMIFEVGRDMEMFYYDRDSLMINIASKNQLKESDINVKEETIMFLNDYLNEQFVNNEYLYMNYLKEKALVSVNRFKQIMIEFHSQDKNIEENKKIIMNNLIDYVNKTKDLRMEEFKTKIYNATILQNMIDKNIREDNHRNKEICVNLVEAEIRSIIENFLINISFLLEDVFYERLFFYVMRELPSDRNTVKAKVIRIREKIVEFLKKERESYTKFDIFQKIKYLFTRFLPNCFRSELSSFKFQVYDIYSTDYWINGREVTQFFDHLLKKLPAFVSLLGLQYQKKIYSGKSNDLYQQAEHLNELINNCYKN